MKQIFSIIIVMLANAASAVDLEIGAGMTKWSMPPNSQYYQQEFPHHFDLKSRAYYIGATGLLDQSFSWNDGVRWRAGWLDLGVMKGQALATSDDANYSGTGGGCYDMSRCRPEDLSQWDVHGKTRGVEFSLAPEWNVGSVRLSLKAGVLVHRPSVKVRIWRDDADPARKGYDYQERINFAPVIGFGGEYQGWTIMFSLYKIDATSKGEDNPADDVNTSRIPPAWGTDKIGSTKSLFVTKRF